MIELLKENWERVNSIATDATNKAGRNVNDITILPVSKTKPIQMLFDAISAGMNMFGENYAQELKQKYEEFDKISKTQPIWHYIGGLQKSNVKYISHFVDMIHSVDSVKIAQEINKRAIIANRKIDCLLQINTSGELSKSGCAPKDIINLAKATFELKNINIKGLMTIGSFPETEKIARLLCPLLDAYKNLPSELI